MERNTKEVGEISRRKREVNKEFGRRMNEGIQGKGFCFGRKHERLRSKVREIFKE